MNLTKLVALLKIRIILKNEPNRCTLEEVIAKSRYPDKCPKKRGDLTSDPNFKFQFRKML